MRAAILAHGMFPGGAKTATGILRYGDQEIVAVLDRDQPGTRVSEFDLRGTQDAPVVESMDEVPECDALLIGIAPIGGGFDESWRSDIRTAIERGCDVYSGLHYYLQDDEEFAELADEYGVELRDVRKAPEDLTVSEGIAREVDATVLLTAGTDASIGKLTTTMELVEAAEEAGIDAAAVPTGQTGIMIEGWGIAIDHVISDFMAGAVERMVLEAAEDNDLVVVEGQGGIVHPAYSGVTCGLLHGAMPDGLVLVHDPTRERVHGYDQFPLASPPTIADVYETLAAPVHETEVLAGTINTSMIDEEDEARQVVEEYGAEIDAPATDPVRFGAEEIVEAVR